MAKKITITSCSYSILLLTIFLRFTHASLPAIFIFGDSTFDVGTNNFIPGSLDVANFPFNGIDYPYSTPTGRFSNGYNTADQIVRLFGYNRSPPCFLCPVNHFSSFKKRILEGVNFASGGSGILDSTGFHENVISLRKQIEQFYTVCGNITALQGLEKTATMLSESLFLISVGGNDLFDYQRSIAKGSTNMTGQELLAILMETYQLHLQNLYDLGARKFGIVSIPPIGCCPFEHFTAKTVDCVKELNDLAQAFFSGTEALLRKMSSQVVGMKYSLGNAYGITLDIIDNPLVFGFKEVKDACCGNGSFNGGGQCNTRANLCHNREEYFFWDWFHPTEAASRLAALFLFDGEERYVTPMNFSQLVQISTN